MNSVRTSASASETATVCSPDRSLAIETPGDDGGQYQGSQAFNQSFTANEFVTRNTGSLSVSKALVNLRGVGAGVGLTINLSYAAGTSGLLGLPGNWGFGLAYLVPEASLTSQGKTSIIDPDWADSTGYRSGLRYVNNHGIAFRSVIPPQPLPSGQPGTYSYTLTYDDGACDYYDLTGKLVEHDDLFGNHINYYYTDPYSGVFGNRLDHIVDSFGQTVSFGYGPNAIVVTTPDGSRTTINFSDQGVQNVQDALGNVTTFGYMTVAGQSVVATVRYPTGLTTQLAYTTLAYLASDGSQQAFPAVSDHYHLDAGGNVLEHTQYTFGTDSGGNTFTGISAGYQLSGASDGLMESDNTLYAYDVLVTRLDAGGTPLAASRVYFNYLHLPTREEHYFLANGTVTNGYRALYSYDVDPDYHARATNYAQPVLTQQFVYAPSTKSYLPLRQSTASYDAYGRILASGESLYDPVAQAWVAQMTTTNTWAPAAWGGEMPLTEVYVDNVSGFQRQVAYTLTGDQKNVASSAVLYRSDAQSAWSPWKTKSYAYDASGRVTSTALAWSSGVTPPPGGVGSTTSTNAYAYDAATRAYTVSSTNALDDTSTRTYDTGIVGGPMTAASTPLGETASYAYDALGRLTRATDAAGYVTTYAYALAAASSANSVLTTGPTGYLVAQVFDALGRESKTLDNGDPTQPAGAAPNRTLRQVGYDALGRVVQTTDELGLVSTATYDSLSRNVSSTDSLGNVGTTVFDDATGTISAAMNGALRSVTRLDGLGRTISTTEYPDASDTSLGYCRLHELAYDGFGHVTGASFSTVPLGGGSPQVLYSGSFTRDVESRITVESYTGTNGSPVTVSRTASYDLFGNALASVKRTSYADGRAYENSASTPSFDAAGQLASITNGLGQVERYGYDADGRMQTRTRYDGTTFTYSYDAKGQLLGLSWPGGGVTHTYLPNERVATTTGAGGTLSYAYYVDGSARSVTYPDGRTQSYTTDRFSRVVAATDASGASTAIAFDAYGRVAQRQHSGDTVAYQYGTVNHTLGVPVGNTLTGSTSLSRQIAYDGFGQTSATVAGDGSGRTVLATRYARDGAGRLTSVALSSATSSDPSVNATRAPSYDGLDQVVALATTYAGGQAPDSVAFTYDGNFNVLTRTDNGAAQQFAYNAVDQLASTGIAYDTNGRMTADGSGRTYTYNALDQLTGVAGSDGTPLIAYAYHPDGALAATKAVANALGFYYDGGAANAISTSTGGGANAAWTTFLLDATERRAAYGTGTAPSYFMTSTESTSLLQQGASASTALAYDAYGALDNDAEVAADRRFTWNQEYADAVSGLVYLRSRYYHPTLMRFMTMDSLTMDNRYAYCSGDPLNRVDPSGHMDTREIVGLVVGAVVGIVATVATGGAAGAAAAAVFGTESVAASVGATALAGAAGSIAGDATNAGIAGQKFTGERALVDLASGAVGGAVGAGVGGYAGRTAMSAALAQGMSQRAITNIGLVCSGLAGGISGSAAASAVSSIATGQPFFSANTAISMAVGAAAGVGGGFLTSGAYLGKLGEGKIIPVPLTESDLALIRPAVNRIPGSAAQLDHELLVMAPQKEAMDSARGFNTRYGTYRSSLTLDYQPGSTSYDTIAAHGAGNTMFVSVEYQRGLLANGDPNYVRPIKGSVFAEYLRQNPGLIGGLGGPGGNNAPIKLMTCFGAFSNAQTIADALQRPVWAGYPEIDRYTFTNWKYFAPA